MSLAAMIVVSVAGLLLLALLPIVAALFTPVVFTLDSEKWQVRVRWLVALEYWRRLPGANGEAGLSIAGKAIRLPAKREAPRRLSEAAAPAPKPKKDRARAARFLRFARACLKHSSIRAALVRSARRLWRDLFCNRARSVSLRRLQVAISLPDPAWNGMLMGWLAASGHGLPGRTPQMRVNFAGKNSILLEARLYPYRAVKALAGFLLAFLVGLPYGTLWREWRASSVSN